MTRQNQNNTLASNKWSFEMGKQSLEFQETNIFYICTQKDFEKQFISQET